MINQSIYKQRIDTNKTKSKKEQKRVNKLEKILQKDINLFSSRFKEKHKQNYYSELAILLRAGVDLVEALDIIRQQYKQSKIKTTIKKIQELIVDGESLSQAMRQSNQFSDYELFSLQIGEESGQLIEILNELSDFYSKRIQQRRKIIGALSYPFIVSLIAVLAIVFMLRFLVPMFSSVYKQFGGELPQITKFVLALSNGLKNHSLFILIGFALSIGLYFMVRHTILFKKITDFSLFHIPLFGKIFRKIYLARFARSMSLLLGAGIPLVSAIDFSQKMINRWTIQQFLEKSKDDIFHGHSLHSSLAKFYLFPPKFISMVKVGESTNQLPYLFDQLSNQYTEEIDHQTGLINSILEPLLILFLGVIVGFILIALYLPIFELSTNFGI